jgi:hypothetical protein
MQAMQSQELETPIGALTSLNLSDYDKIIAEFQQKNAERDAAKERVLRAVRNLAEQIGTVLKQIPELELRQLTEESRALQGIERTISDGLPPPGISDLLTRFDECVTSTSKFEKNLPKKINLICPAVQKLDSKLAADIRRLLGDTGRIARRLRVHYEHMAARIKDLMNLSTDSLDGPVRRAYALYAEAFNATNGVREIGSLEVDLRDRLPLYESAIRIDPLILEDRGRLYNLERAVDDYVEQRDPASVGIIVFRFEPAIGAA